MAQIRDRLREIGGDAAVTADTLEELSPSSLVITLASIRRAREHATLAEALLTEYEVGSFLIGRPDMAEGIRAQLVDKDFSPVWSPAAIDEVPADLVEQALAHRASTPLWA